MRILMIAPEASGISLDSEIERVTEEFHTVVLSGQVDAERLIGSTSGRRFEIVHITAHADDNGVQMRDWIMGPETVSQIAKHVRAQLVFLNTCRSLYLPQYLIDQGVPAVIGHAVAQMDSNALRLAAYFYDELRRTGNDYRAAYEAVNPKNGTLTWFSNGHFAEMLLQPLMDRISEIESSGDVQRRFNYVISSAVLVELGLMLWVAARLFQG